MFVMKRKFRSFVSVVLSALMVIAFVTQTFAIPAGAEITFSNATDASFEVLQPNARQDDVITNDVGNASSSAPTGANPTPTPTPTGVNPTPAPDISIRQQLINREGDETTLLDAGDINAAAPPTLYLSSGLIIKTVGETEFIYAYLTASYLGYYRIEWSSSNNRVASLSSPNSSGTSVMAVGPGDCSLTATARDISGNIIASAQCQVIVKAPTPTPPPIVIPPIVDFYININANIGLLHLGEVVTLRTTLRNYTGPQHHIEWSLSNPDVVKIVRNDVSSVDIAASSPGTCVITATAKDIYGTIIASDRDAVTVVGNPAPPQIASDHAVELYRDINYSVMTDACSPPMPFPPFNVMPVNHTAIDDSISSLMVRDGYRVILCEDMGYSGRQLWFTSNAPSLSAYNFNDKTSSYIVLRNSAEPTLPTLYEHAAFQGSTVSLDEGYYPNLGSYGFDNQTTGIIVPQGYKVTLSDGINVTGSSYVVTGPAYIPYWNNGFNDSCSSVRVTKTSEVNGQNEYDCLTQLRRFY
jgi:hypothetical protein